MSFTNGNLQKALKKPSSGLFYETTSPFRPNIQVFNSLSGRDVTSYYTMNHNKHLCVVVPASQRAGPGQNHRNRANN